MLTSISVEAWWWIGATFFVLGVIGAVQAVMETRTPQGALAWVIALLALPVLAVPLYWIFGYRNFKGYKRGLDIFSRKSLTEEHKKILAELKENSIATHPLFEHNRNWQEGALSYFSEGNSAKLLINAPRAYERLFEAIKGAQKYILIEFYIIQRDATGEKLRDALIEKAKEGVECYIMFDAFGGKRFRKFVKPLQKAGVHIYSFQTNRGARYKLRLNFRNHRKIVIIDGEFGFIGGINIGDEYLGLHKKLKPWRDTNVELCGPSVLLMQYAFQRDWEFAAGRKLSGLSWEISKKSGASEVMIVPTSPVSFHDYGSLFFLHLINSAQKRLWIFNPYFVPDEQFVSALQLASLRGVEVKIVTPRLCDGFLVENIGIGVMQSLERFENIEWYQYLNGFMHQKVFLVDDDLTLIGTHNFDNRSFRLNFELSALIRDPEFQKEVEVMLREDLQHSEKADKGRYRTLPFFRRLIIRFVSLLSPIA